MSAPAAVAGATFFGGLPSAEFHHLALLPLVSHRTQTGREPRREQEHESAGTLADTYRPGRTWIQVEAAGRLGKG